MKWHVLKILRTQCVSCIQTVAWLHFYQFAPRQIKGLWIVVYSWRGWKGLKVTEKIKWKIVPGCSSTAWEHPPLFRCWYQGETSRTEIWRPLWPPPPPHSLQTLLLLIFICLDHLRRLWEVTDFQMKIQGSKWCITGSALDQKMFLFDGTAKLVDCWIKCIDKQEDDI